MTAITLNTLLTNLADGDVEILSGVEAQLTRQSYIDPYLLEINFQQFVPIVYFNIIEGTISISNTNTLNFTQEDLFVNNDWICLNEAPV